MNDTHRTLPETAPGRSADAWNLDTETERRQGHFLLRHRFACLGVVMFAGVAVVIIHALSGSHPSAHSAPSITMISLPPPPPPAPTPPPPKIEPQPQQEQKLTDQPQVMEPETKPEDKARPEPPKPDEPPAGLGTGIKGDGSADGFGLGGSGNGGLFGGGGGRGGSKYGWYAGQVQSRIADALRADPKTRSSGLSVQVRIWADETGRITRAQLAGSTGDRALDGEISQRILTGLQLPEPPPAGMPMPIVLRLTARRPS